MYSNKMKHREHPLTLINVLHGWSHLLLLVLPGEECPYWITRSEQEKCYSKQKTCNIFKDFLISPWGWQMFHILKHCKAKKWSVQIWHKVVSQSFPQVHLSSSFSLFPQLFMLFAVLCTQRSSSNKTRATQCRRVSHPGSAGRGTPEWAHDQKFAK